MRAGPDVRRRLSALSGEARILLLLSSVLVLIVLSNRFGVLMPDTKPEMFLQPVQTAERFTASWLDTPNLGAANYNTGTAAVAWVFAALDAVGIPPWLIGRIWRILLLLLAGWGARLVVRELVQGSLNTRGVTIAGVAGAIAYVANPYVVVGGGTTPTLQPYALLPWLVVCWIRGARQPTWRWAVLAALALTGMGAINAGVVPVMQLVVVLPVLAHTVLVEGHRFLSVVWLIVRTGLIYVFLSAYWLVPAVGALGFATSVARGSETIEAINMANSYPEVLRGLGMWTLYGLDGHGPFDPNRIAYVASPFIVALSFGGPILAALGVRLTRSPARLFGATSMLTGALIMVGSFTTGTATAWGSALEAFLENVPGMLAFRTTNKVGAVLELGLAVLIALAAAAVAARVRTVWQRAVALLAGGLIGAGSIAPALTGGLFWIPMDLPDYWNDVAETVNGRGAQSRVLMLPGVGLPTYSWGYSGPDELGPSLFTRPFVFRSAALPGGDYSNAMLSEVDRRLQEGTLPPGTLSTMADYLGVGDIVARYDLRSDSGLGERVEAQLEADPGLGPPQVFGSDTGQPGAPGAVTVREVRRVPSAATARARSLRGGLIIDGSGAALPALTEVGLLNERPVMLLSGGLDDKGLAEAIRQGGRLVLTDSNLRREWSVSNPVGVGPIQSADAATRLTRGLFSVDQQSTAQTRGNADLEVSGDGLLFGPYSYGAVENAFDGDRTTSWRFGNFGTGVANAVRIIPHDPIPMPTLTLIPHQGGSSYITDVRIAFVAGGRTVTQDLELSPWRSFPTTVHVSDEPVSSLEVTVTSVAGSGDGAVGFAEIDVPGVDIAKTVRVSADLAERASAAARSVGVDLADVLVDVVLQRGLGDHNGLTVDEPRLEREFTVPDARRFSLAGRFRLAAGVSDDFIDAVAGTDGQLRATSSSRLFNRMQARASKAIDSVSGRPNLATAWVPNDPVVGEWIAVDFPSRSLDSFTLTQNDGPDLATRVLVAINDEEPFEVALGAGENTVTLPKSMEAHRIRILIAERAGLGFVRFTDIGLPGQPTDTPSSTQSLEECVHIGAIDDVPIRARIGTHRTALLAGEAIPLDPCDDGLDLQAGTHVLASGQEFAIDTLHLSTFDATVHPSIGVPLTIQSARPDRVQAELPQGCSSCVISAGQAYDPRWRATLNGEDIGDPIVVDGFSAGWFADEAPPQSQIVMEFGMRGMTLAAWSISGMVLAACLSLLIVDRRTRRGSAEPLSSRGDGG